MSVAEKIRASRERSQTEGVGSQDGKRMFHDLLGFPIKERREWMDTLDVAEMNVLMQVSLKEAGTAYALWRDDPVGFVEDILAEQTWSKQRDVLAAIGLHKQVAVPSAFGTGKTHIAARATLWRSLVHPPGTSLTITTATRFRQVQRQLWPHIRQAVAKSNLPLKADTTQLKAYTKAGAEVVVAYGFSAPPHDEAAVQGIHAPRLFIVVDEAGGIARTIGQAMRGLMTGEDTRMLAIGNPPTDDEGSWFESLCSKDDVEVVRISAWDAPILSGEVTDRCRTCPDEMDAHPVGIHIVDRKWVEDTINDYGEDAPFVIAKVDAKFPKGGSNRALPSTWIEAAVDEPEPVDTDGYVRLDSLGLEGEDEGWLVKLGAWVRLGVDVAADGGDEMAISRTIGNLAEIRHLSSGAENVNATDVAGKILAEIKRAEALRAALGTTAKVRVKVDAIGVGWGVVGILEAWASEGLHDAEIVRVVVSEGTRRDDSLTSDTFRPYRKRDEMWLATRSLLVPVKDALGVVIGSKVRFRIDEQTKAQLAAPAYGTNAQGKTVIESKKSMKQRGLKSPDRGEALLLAWYEPYVEPVRRARLIV